MPSTKATSIDSFVADASVGVAWALESQATAGTDLLLDRIDAGARFLVPVLWPFEVANALVLLLRRNKITMREFARARNEIEALVPLIDDQGPHLATREISRLAQQFGLTIYDATYLELTIRRGLPLASRDAALNEAARKTGIGTLL